jgi:hypothetical protein
VETQRVKIPTLNKLLTSGPGSPAADVAREQRVEAADPTLDEPRARRRSDRATEPIILPSSAEHLGDRRVGKPDRRVGMPDLRVIKVERRGTVRDRRVKPGGRRASD